jgi:hypothetical protein
VIFKGVQGLIILFQVGENEYGSIETGQKMAVHVAMIKDEKTDPVGRFLEILST